MSKELLEAHAGRLGIWHPESIDSDTRAEIIEVFAVRRLPTKVKKRGRPSKKKHYLPLFALLEADRLKEKRPYHNGIKQSIRLLSSDPGLLDPAFAPKPVPTNNSPSKVDALHMHYNKWRDEIKEMDSEQAASLNEDWNNFIDGMDDRTNETLYKLVFVLYASLTDCGEDAESQIEVWNVWLALAKRLLPAAVREELFCLCTPITMQEILVGLGLKETRTYYDRRTD